GRGNTVHLRHNLSRRSYSVLVAFASLILTVSRPQAAQATGAAGPNTVLILSTTVTGGASSLEATDAAALGYNVELVDGDGWTGKTTADFATYKALILGDPICGSVGSTAAAQATTAVWGPAVTGNVIIVGTDPSYHASSRMGAAQLVQSGIQWAAGATS